MRQDCETLNNVLLSEFDYFSESMLDDLETVMLSLLKSQADHYHKVELLQGPYCVILQFQNSLPLEGN